MRARPMAQSSRFALIRPCRHTHAQHTQVLDNIQSNLNSTTHSHRYPQFSFFKFNIFFSNTKKNNIQMKPINQLQVAFYLSFS
jgi:hypothetical protein